LDKHLAPANKLADACDHGVAIVSVDHNSVVQLTSASLGGAGLIVDEHVRMARRRYGPEEIVAKLRQVEALRSRGQTCTEAVRSIGVSEVTYRRWRAEFGGLIRTLGPNHSSVKKPRNT
jgi:hypothetical protein